MLMEEEPEHESMKRPLIVQAAAKDKGVSKAAFQGFLPMALEVTQAA